MAARKSSTLSPRHREAIQTSMLLKRLEGHVLSGVEMSKTQVQAALGLLRKTMPDLAVTQHTGDAANPIQTSLTVTFRSPGG